MLLTDQAGYPRAYGANDVIYYLVVYPGAKLVYVAGCNDATYQLTTRDPVYATEADLSCSRLKERLPVPPNLAAQVAHFRWRQHATH